MVVRVGDDRGVEMRQRAERYCALIEAAGSYDREAFVAALVPALAGLLSAASELPAVLPGSGDLAGRPSDEEWGRRLKAVQSVLGDWTYYRTTFAIRGDADAAVSMGFLDDDLADIWRDMRHTLRALEGGAPIVDVTWEWRLGFYTHWGEHATQALRVLHERLTDNGALRAIGSDPSSS